MKKTTIIGGAIVILLIGAISLFFMLNRMAPQVQKDALDYVDTNVPLIIRNWDSGELIGRASRGLLNVVPREQFVELFNTLSQKLGSLKEYRGSTGQTNLRTSFKGINRTGVFEAEAVFAKAPAIILCRIVWQGNAWKIEEFRVKSNVLNH